MSLHVFDTSLTSTEYTKNAKLKRNEDRLKRVCDLPYSISVTEHFRNKIKKIWSVRTKIALIEKIFRKKKFADMFLLFM